MTLATRDDDAKAIIDEWIEKTGTSLTTVQRTELHDLICERMLTVICKITSHYPPYCL